jgi:tRNA pseudouridine55 synthase
LAAELHGVLVVDKPPRLTSAAVVAKVKHALGARSVGHTGTLDPMATGVLPIVLGEATKLATFLIAEDKAYDGELELGFTTDTLDADGQVTARRDPTGVTREALEAAMATWLGEKQQIPPMYSALKQDGKRLHELARAGVEVEREPRAIRIDRFALESFTPPRARFTVECSKGTYVRSLVRDVGEALGCGATLTALRRTRSGRFTLADAVPLDRLDPERLVAPPDAVDHLPAIRLDGDGVTRVRHGKPIRSEGQGMFRLLTPAGALAAVAEGDGTQLRTLRVFNYGLTAP